MSTAETLRVRELRITPLAIPMRLKFEHAAAARNMADPVVVQAIAASPFDGLSGWGETLARPYVTGETAETVVRDVETIFAPLAAKLSVSSFEEAIPLQDALPFSESARCIHAARAAVELALLDLACRAWRRRPIDVPAVLQFQRVRPGGPHPTIRYSGVVIGKSAWKSNLLLRARRAYGLQDFKVKVAIDGWQQRVEHAARTLGLGKAGPVPCTLRADANGGWSLDEALAAIPILERAGVCALEQPFPPERDADLAPLAQATRVSLIADESLLTLADASRLLDSGARIMNIRIAKQGGLLPSWRMAEAVLARGGEFQLGCLVGETSILTAAGAAFLEAAPQARFAEGAFGRWLLLDDVTDDSIRFRLGGRIKPQAGPGWGIDVNQRRVGSRAKVGRSRRIML
jgi:muconate cycloisomerase